MHTIADAVIDHLGGTTAVAKLIEAPVSTVHSWRTIGIPSSRLAHLRLVAQAEGKPLPDDLATMLDGEHNERDTAPAAERPQGKSGGVTPAAEAA